MRNRLQMTITAGLLLALVAACGRVPLPLAPCTAARAFRVDTLRANVSINGAFVRVDTVLAYYCR